MPILIKGSGSVKEPMLQSKSITPTGSGAWYSPDSGYDGFSSFTVGKRNASIVPSTGNAAASQVRSGKKFRSGGVLRTGTMKDVEAPIPGLITSFNSDNTKLTVEASYIPSVGYIADAEPKSLSKEVAIPQSDDTQYACTVLTDYVNAWNDDGLPYINIYVSTSSYSGKTLKYIILSARSDLRTWSTSENQPLMCAVHVDVAADKAYTTEIIPDNTFGQYGIATISNVSSSSNGVLWYTVSVDDGDTTTIQFRFSDSGLALTYNYMLIYQ